MLGRIIGWFFAAAAAIIFGGDALQIIASGTFGLRSLGEILHDLNPDMLNLMQAVIQRYIHPTIWDPGVVTILLWPAAPTFLALAIILLISFRKKEPRRRGIFSGR